MLQCLLGVDAGFVQHVDRDVFLFFSGIWVTTSDFWAVEGGLVLNVEGSLFFKASLVRED